MEKKKYIIILGIVFWIGLNIDSKAEEYSSDIFRTQLDQDGDPVSPTAIIPNDLENNRIFLPFQDQDLQKLAIGMDGIEKKYRMTALWLDCGEKLRVLERREELNEKEYIKRYGNGAIDERTIPESVLYQGRDEGIVLTEPPGFDQYIWEVSDGNEWIQLQTGPDFSYRIEDIQENVQFRCRVKIGSYEYITGELYSVEWIRLGRIQGIEAEKGSV